MKKSLLTMVALMASFGLHAIETETVDAVGNFNFGENAFAVSADLNNPAREIEAPEGDVMLSFDVSKCKNASYSYSEPKKALALYYGVQLDLSFASICEQEQTVRSIEVTYQQGAAEVLCDAAALTKTENGNVVTYTPVAPAPLAAYSLYVATGKESTPQPRALISSIKVNYSYEAEVVKPWTAEWSLLLNGTNETDLLTSATTATDGDYSVTVPRVMADEGIAFKHNGKFYTMEGVVATVNGDPVLLSVYDELPANDKQIHLNMNAQNVTIKVIDEGDDMSPMLYVTGEKYEDKPVVTYPEWSLTYGSATIQLATTDGVIYTGKADKVNADEVIYLTNNGKNYSSQGELEVNGEYEASLMWIQEASTMHLNKDASDVTFTFDAEWKTLRVAGQTSAPVAADWQLRLSDGTVYAFVATGGKDEDGGVIYEASFDSFSKDAQFYVLHKGTEYSCNSVLELNGYAGYLGDFEVKPMQINENAVDVVFRLIDNPDWGSITLEVKGTKAGAPVINPEAWTLVVDDSVFELSAGLGGMYVKYLGADLEVSAVTSVKIMHDGKYWSTADGLLGVKTENAMVLTASDEEKVMHFNCNSAHDLTFMLTPLADTAELRIDGEADTTGVEGIAAEEEEAQYFTLDGVKTTATAPGLYIKVINGKAVKIRK